MGLEDERWYQCGEGGHRPAAALVPSAAVLQAEKSGREDAATLAVHGSPLG
jgi:hypothetical protein